MMAITGIGLARNGVMNTVGNLCFRFDTPTAVMCVIQVVVREMVTRLVNLHSKPDSRAAYQQYGQKRNNIYITEAWKIKINYNQYLQGSSWDGVNTALLVTEKIVGKIMLHKETIIKGETIF